MLFVGNDWAEDHHDVEIVDVNSPGFGGRCVLPAFAGEVIMSPV